MHQPRTQLQRRQDTPLYHVAGHHLAMGRLCRTFFSSVRGKVTSREAGKGADNERDMQPSRDENNRNPALTTAHHGGQDQTLMAHTNKEGTLHLKTTEQEGIKDN